MMKCLRLLLYLACCLNPISVLSAELILNGISAFEQLRKEYYIGALYLRSPMVFPAEILSDAGHKRMVIRVTTDKWSPRRWALTWQDNIAINNDLSAQPALIENIMSFTAFPQGNLTYGDELIIEYRPVVGTTITLNGYDLTSAKGDGLFEYILKTWIGDLPPSKEFKQRILKRYLDDKEKAWIKQFSDMSVPAERRKVVGSWIKQTEQSEEEDTAARLAAQKQAEEEQRIIEQAKAQELAKQKAAQRAQARKREIAKAKRIAAEKKKAAAQAAARKKANEKPSKPKPKKAEKSKQTLAEENKYYVELFEWDLKRSIRNNVTYPVWAKKFSQSGTVKMNFSIDRDGNILSLENKSDGVSQMLVAEVERAIQETVLFVLPPDKLTGEAWNINFEYIFDLRDTLQPELSKPDKPKSLATKKLSSEAYKKLLAKYNEDIQASVINVIQYPEAARVLRQKGTVEVSILVDSEGGVIEVIDKAPSKYEALNQEMRAAITRASPFLPIPEELNKDKLEVTIEHRFKP